jgi:hypothetical protein
MITEAAAPLGHLTTRDLAILEMIYTCRGCTTAQFHTRFWPAHSPPTACYRRIAHLIAAGYLSAHRLPLLSGVGSGKRFLTLGPAGRSLVEKFLAAPLESLPKSRPSMPFFIHHHEAVGDFRIALELPAEDASDVTLRA